MYKYINMFNYITLYALYYLFIYDNAYDLNSSCLYCVSSPGPVNSSTVGSDTTDYQVASQLPSCTYVLDIPTV